ncbi:TRAP transporter small permease [Sphaerochaeta sp. PS]|uniref:TRAP transporter small permease n=1 Tax=Sphaerochaeta sp. PS TaxID=3076336 RepID=UPI0028A42874|nr:TRAP transporter small permease [Sphaerochaeta sp. PS]MDT4763048.1 TRAP transporter small permease [Sphaerochaeta sp. PS]
MQKLINILYDFIIEYIVRIVGVVLVGTVLLQIFTRVVTRVPFSWTDELARFAFIWYCFLGSVLTMHKRMHLGIDYFESKMKPRSRYINRLFIYGIQIIFSFVLAYYGFKLLSIVGLQKSPIMRLRMKYVYMVLPISGVLYFILGINEIISHIKNEKPKLAIKA